MANLRMTAWPSKALQASPQGGAGAPDDRLVHDERAPRHGARPGWKADDSKNRRVYAAHLTAAA
jgi:hypothetical protein